MLGKRNILILVFVMFMASGCDRSTSSPDIQKIMSDERSIVKNSTEHLHLSKAYYDNNQQDKAMFHMKQAFSLDSALSKELAGPFIGRGVIGRVFVTNETDEGKKLALNPKACFDKDSPVIYASIEIINAQPNTEIESEWVYEISRNEEIQVNSAKFKAEGSKVALVSVRKPDSSWPPGKYKLKVYVNKEKNTDLTFYVF